MGKHKEHNLKKLGCFKKLRKSFSSSYVKVPVVKLYVVGCTLQQKENETNPKLQVSKFEQTSNADFLNHRVVEKGKGTH